MTKCSVIKCRCKCRRMPKCRVLYVINLIVIHTIKCCVIKCRVIKTQLHEVPMELSVGAIKLCLDQVPL